MKLTYELAHAAWRYDAGTGCFYWRYSPRYGIKIGDRAGNFDKGIGYWRLQYRGGAYKASRVAWLMMTGTWPKDQIDHIDGDCLNDVFANLREATNRENCRNRGPKSTNRLGIKGVSKASGKRHGYNVTITADGKTTYVGYFGTVEAAKAAYTAAAKKIHGEFARS